MTNVTLDNTLQSMNGVLVKKWMTENEIRPEELAVKLGVSFSTVRAILVGKTPYRPTITVLAGMMGVRVEDLINQPSRKKTGGLKTAVN